MWPFSHSEEAKMPPDAFAASFTPMPRILATNKQDLLCYATCRAFNWTSRSFEDKKLVRGGRWFSRNGDCHFTCSLQADTTALWKDKNHCHHQNAYPSTTHLPQLWWIRDVFCQNPPGACSWSGPLDPWPNPKCLRCSIHSAFPQAAIIAISLSL